jgi:Domain of unknown function (DUF6916)
MLDKLTIDDFSGRVGETFAATADEGATLTLTLRSADALYTPPGDQGRTPFSLVFTDQVQDHVPQQTVEVEHADLGSFPLFVVPLGASPEGMRYEAVFT